MDSQHGTTMREQYSFARRLPGAKNLCKNDIVIFYRPLSSGTPDAGCLYGAARVERVILHADGQVDASLIGFRAFENPLLLKAFGDPRANPQHSFQRVARTYAVGVFESAGMREEDLR